MKLGLNIGYFGTAIADDFTLISTAEELGFDSVWTAEAYGSDATSPLAYLAAVTTRIRLGTSIMQLAGRTPAMAAMQAATIDALYVGGMGHRDKNFHNDMMVRRGYPEAAAKIQELYLAGRKREATLAVPDEYCDEAALVGPQQRIRDRYKDWESSGATGLTLASLQPEGMELMAELSGSSDRAA